VVVPVTQQMSFSWQLTPDATQLWPQMPAAVQSLSQQSALFTQWCPFS
jgi:hypothetical protein